MLVLCVYLQFPLECISLLAKGALVCFTVLVFSLEEIRCSDGERGLTQLSIVINETKS